MKADIILKSDSIYTGTGSEPFAGAIAVTGRHIACVTKGNVPGSWIAPDTKIFELGDRTILPGLSDNHVHYLLAATIYSDYCCTELTGSRSEEECVSMLKSFYREHSGLDKLIGFGWYTANWTEGPHPHQLPSKESLDEAFPDIPVYLMMADCHTFWCNSKALEICGIHKDMPHSFGTLGLDEHGKLNGILSELELIAPCFNEFYDFPEKESEEMQENLLKEIAKMGVTSITDVAECTVISEEAMELKKMKAMEKKGKLTARIHVYPSLGITPDMTIQTHLRETYSSGLVKIAGLKQFFDGVTSTYTAALIEPYQDKPDLKGRLNYEEEQYDRCIAAANKAGFGVKLHCIGDYAVRAGLDCFEHSKLVNPVYGLCRNAIEHIESLDPSDAVRFKSLDVTASVQPIHLILDGFEKIERIGKERAAYEWPFHTLRSLGANVAFGTDVPVCSVNPFENIYVAVTRKDFHGRDMSVNGQEKVSLKEAIRAYTYGSAYSNKREDELGTLEVGKLADITVVDRDFFSIREEEIPMCRAALTMVDGKVVYENLQDQGFCAE